MASDGRGAKLAWWLSLEGDPGADLAREELLLEAASGGAPRLSCYGWQGPVLVLGYGQDESGIDMAACRAARVPVLRRCSGGTAVLHRGDLSASLALPAGHPWARSIATLYDGFVLAVEGALLTLGVAAERFRPAERESHRRSPICFEDHRAESLLVGGKKVLGCAQTRRREAVLVHGTLLFNLDVALQARVYGVPASRIESAMSPLPPRPGLQPGAAARALAAALAHALDLEAGEPEAPPALPDRLLQRLGDSKWVLAGGSGRP